MSRVDALWSSKMTPNLIPTYLRCCHFWAIRLSICAQQSRSTVILCIWPSRLFASKPITSRSSKISNCRTKSLAILFLKTLSRTPLFWCRARPHFWNANPNLNLISSVQFLSLGGSATLRDFSSTCRSSNRSRTLRVTSDPWSMSLSSRSLSKASGLLHPLMPNTCWCLSTSTQWRFPLIKRMICKWASRKTRWPLCHTTKKSSNLAWNSRCSNLGSEIIFRSRLTCI
jgi:hypothetical protein